MVFREQPNKRPRVDRNLRFCRATISYDPQAAPWSDVSPPDPAPVMQNAVAFNPDTKFHRLKPVKRCIYCDATEYAEGMSRPLGREHVVPEGVGGTLELPESSCRDCEGKTSAIEGATLRHSLLAVRRRTGLFGKKRNRDHVSVSFTSILDGREVTITPPLEDHPTVLVLPRMYPPGLIFPQSGFGGFFVHPLV
jgi:hypothetical protein